MQKDVQWFKIMVHGVAISDFDTVTGMAELQKDIEMFNPKLRLATLPRWVIFRVSLLEYALSLARDLAP
jgi:hypothetical protein